MTDLSIALCRKSTHSREKGTCLELALNVPGVGAVRDSKAPEQGALVFSPTQLRGFLVAVKSGRFDR
ncbi:DUF397 domain-containing protein [Saccharopolyspora spinosa]|uniref:Uncharacterized protein DUF397 n=1 Tax=Saccharopolyspora spinosa TaxID=60894 RepID=A0A2N3XPZ4_SACSN|nr:DUF397 domain-containing protein [Saccharopolyspora spinosa]PKW12757.1 uncharacterized protein DUF397 [Saccharopolyspora spinosa]